MKDTLPVRVRFGAFELDLKAGELRPADTADDAADSGIVLSEQPFRLLLMLVERDGDIVTREEIKKKFWPNDTIVEFDHSINVAIGKLRKALGDSADEPQYVETVARRGYRLMVPVEWIDAAPTLSPKEGDKGGAPTHTPPDPGLTGRTVSHYRVLDIIGGGGMGVVYRAEDLKLGRQVALKFLPEELGSDPQALERFSREARAASSLDHPNICSIYEFGDHEGRPFMVMQLLEGQTLRDRLAANGRAIPLEELLDIGIQICDGLQAAHERGIIHRDIKPANIFLTNKGACKILDFGLAKLLEGDTEEEVAAQPDAPTVTLPAVSGAMHLTRTGVAMGTAGYMSPEQVRGEKLDARSDLFSFGLVLYEMATGRRAFSGGTAAFIYDAILKNSPVPARELNSTLPPRLATTIAKTLEKSPELRCQSAAEIGSELRSVKRETEAGSVAKPVGGDLPALSVASPPERAVASRPRRWMYALSVVALAAVTGLGWLVYRKVMHPTVAEVPQSVVRLTEDGGALGPGALSPDGKYFVYQRKASGKTSLWIQQVATGSSLKITPDLDVAVAEVTFSPDNTLVYYELFDTGRMEHRLYKVPTLGGTPEMFLAGTLGTIGFSPDGRQIAYKRLSEKGTLQVVVANADGSEPRVLYSRESPPGVVPRSAPAWSPDGKLIAIAQWTKAGQPSYSTISFIDRSGQVTELKLKGLEIRKLAWLPDCSGLIFVGNPAGPEPQHIFMVSYPEGRVTRITNDSSNYEMNSLSMTPDGKTLFAILEVTRTSLWLATDGFRNTRQIPSPGTQLELDFDGRQIVYISSVGEAAAVWRSDVSGAPPVRITAADLDVPEGPTLSPDGRRIAFAAHKTPNMQTVWITDIDGGNLQQITGTDSAFHPLFTPGGNEILFGRVDKDAGQHLYRVPLAGGPPVRVSDLPIGRAWSIAGDSILCSYFDASALDWRRAIMSLHSGRLVRTLDFPGWTWVLKFSPDGKSISYVDNHDGSSNVWSVPVEGGPAKKLTSFTSEEVFDFAWSRDGKQLLLSRGNQYSDAILIHNFPATAQH